MANLVYKRVSTDQQSTDRQNLLLDEAGIEDPVVFEEQAGTCSRLHPLQRPKFSDPSPTRGRAEQQDSAVRLRAARGRPLRPGALGAANEEEAGPVLSP